ncbi:hypothetical protein SFRURICE_011885 [Spodoptera frugiperda]|nr:hypothetical protein SFRURICE_011885 [Spodoptera frugiperda]
MPPSATSRRILCINCNVCINTFRRYLVHELNTRVISLLSEWISPVIITEEDYICEPCNELLMRTVNQKLTTSCDGAQASGSSQPGRRQVCSICGRSTHNRQSHAIVIDNPSEEQRRINAVIQTRIAPRQISSSDKICHACWMSCKRAAIRIDHADDARGVYTTEEVEVETGDSEPFTAEPVHENLDVPSEVASSEIMMENYRRAANTASHCLFPQCSNINLHNLSDSFRATILSTYKYYIPVHSRVCSEHRLSNQWSNLFDSSNSIRTFTLEQVEHVFSFVNAFKPYLNFTTIEGIQEIEDNIFFFWTGRSKQDFLALINEVPRIQGMHKGLLGLAALLIKMRTENDVFILDRGFRDSIRMLEGCNYRAYMPESLLEDEHQLTTQQANRSRCVTICRWVVEAVNGQFKRDFKLLRQDYFNKSVPNMMQNFQIAASLLNRFGVRFQDRNDANEIVTIIRERINFENNLAILVEQLNMNRRLEWPVRTLSFSFDGRLLASASEDHIIDIGDTETGEKVAEIPVQASTFTVAWHPSRYLVAFACEDKEPPERKRDAGNLKLWGLPNSS